MIGAVGVVAAFNLVMLAMMALTGLATFALARRLGLGRQAAWWAGALFMCTDDKSFTIRDTQDCVKRGYKQTGFFEVDTGEERDWTVRLTDPEGETKSQ